MKPRFFVAVILLVAIAALAANKPDFSGSWEFNVEKSRNIGMMSQMKMVQTIQQSNTSLDVSSHSIFQGSEQEMKTHYDLTGKPAINESPMAGPSETVTNWDGNKLVTTWTSQGAVADSKVVRTETRSLSVDGKIMTVESVRGSNPPVVLIFEKKR